VTAPIELIPPGIERTAHRRSIVWSPGDDAAGFATDHDCYLTQFGAPGNGALTFARVGVGAFLADRAIRRNELRQRRQITLIVRVPDPDLGAAATNDLASLLRFVTGDDWDLRFEKDTTERPSVRRLRSVDEVALLSGGLDSYCGAVLGGTTRRLFLSHADAPVITHSQHTAVDHIPQFDPDNHFRVRLAATKPFSVEPSRRSRSILFMALAVALADASGAVRVEVPENGFTSLNPPLAANRAGVLTTRSTHPMTFELASRAVNALGIQVTLQNPYEWCTKGELVALAVQATGEEQVTGGIASTLSCAKTNVILPGSGAGRNCGLDYACLVRRAGVRAAGIADSTDYLCDDPALLPGLADLRRSDIEAVRLALPRPPSVAALAGESGPFPPGYDYDRAVDLWRRGIGELSALTLP